MNDAERNTPADNGEEETSSEESGECGFGEESVVMGGPVLPLPGEPRMCMMHDAEHNLKPGLMYPMKEGVPIPENAHLLEHVGGNIYKPGPSVAQLKQGPVQVSTPAYRQGYDRIFGKKPVVGIS